MASDRGGMSWQCLTPLRQNQFVGKAGHVLINIVRWLTYEVLLLGIKSLFTFELGG